MPPATVAAILTRAGGPGEVLLTRRNVPPFRGQWCLPGGHIEPFEPAQSAILREVEEETGLAFEPQFMGYCDEILPAQDIHAVVLVFVGQALGSPDPEEAEVIEMQWFAVEEALRLPLAFDHRTILEAYRESLG